MLGFIEKIFFAAMTFFSFNVLNVNSIECVSLNNQECKTRTKIIISTIMSLCFIHSVLNVNKCSGSCNNINDPYAKLCVPDAVKKNHLVIKQDT